MSKLFIRMEIVTEVSNIQELLGILSSRPDVNVVANIQTDMGQDEGNGHVPADAPRFNVGDEVEFYGDKFTGMGTVRRLDPDGGVSIRAHSIETFFTDGEWRDYIGAQNKNLRFSGEEVAANKVRFLAPDPELDF